MSELREQISVQRQELEDLHDVVVDLERARGELSVRLAAAESLQRDLAAIDARSEDISRQISATDARVAAIDGHVVGIREAVGLLAEDLTGTVNQAQSELFERMSAMIREELREHLKASNDVHRRQVELLAGEIREQLQRQDAGRQADIQSAAARASEAATMLQQFAAGVTARQESIATTADAVRKVQKRDSALLHRALRQTAPPPGRNR